MVEENQRRDSELRPSCVRLQCLRCRSEFTLQGGGGEGEAGGRARRRGAAMLPECEEELDGPKLTEAEHDCSEGESHKLKNLRNNWTNKGVKKLAKSGLHPYLTFTPKIIQCQLDLWLRTEDKTEKTQDKVTHLTWHIVTFMHVRAVHDCYSAIRHLLVFCTRLHIFPKQNVALKCTRRNHSRSYLCSFFPKWPFLLSSLLCNQQETDNTCFSSSHLPAFRPNPALRPAPACRGLAQALFDKCF